VPRSSPSQIPGPPTASTFFRAPPTRAHRIRCWCRGETKSLLTHAGVSGQGRHGEESQTLGRPVGPASRLGAKSVRSSTNTAPYSVRFLLQNWEAVSFCCSGPNSAWCTHSGRPSGQARSRWRRAREHRPWPRQQMIRSWPPRAGWRSGFDARDRAAPRPLFSKQPEEGSAPATRPPEAPIRIAIPPSCDIPRAELVMALSPEPAVPRAHGLRHWRGDAGGRRGGIAGPAG